MSGIAERAISDGETMTQDESLPVQRLGEGMKDEG